MDGLLQVVEACEGSCHDVRGVSVVHRGELELVDVLAFKNLGTGLECLGEHEAGVEGVLEHVRIFFLFSNIVVNLNLGKFEVVFLGQNLVLSLLGHLELADFVLLDFILEDSNVVFGFKISVLLIVDVVLLDHVLVVLGLILLLLLENLMLVSLTLLLHVLDGEVAESPDVLDLGLVLSAEFTELLVLYSSELIELGIDLHPGHLSFLVLLLTEVSLEILEERCRRNEHFGDLDGFELDAPSGANLLEVLSDGSDDGLAVLHDGVQLGVGDLISHNGSSLLLQVAVCSLWVVG